MSDQSQGPGWWIASDGKWYPPESAPTTPQPVGPPPKPRRTGLIVALAVVVVVVVAGALLLLAGGSDDDGAVDDIDTSPFEPQTFDDAEAVVDQLNDGGVDCADYEELEPEPSVLGLDGAATSGQCTVDDTVVLINTYEDEGAGEDLLEAISDLGDCDEGGEPADGVTDYVYGANWLIGFQPVVTAGDDHGPILDDIAEALYGETADLGCDS